MLPFDLQRFARSDNYVCLMHFDSSVTKDEIGRLNWQIGGSPSIVDSNSFSGKSLYITTNNYLYATHVDLGSNGFTIEFWVTFSQTTVVAPYSRVIELMSNGKVPRISLNCNGAGGTSCQAIILGQNGDGNNVNMDRIMLPSDSSTTLPTTRVHIAFVFRSSTQKGYIFSNGKLRKSGSVVFASYPVIFDKIAIGRCLFNNNNNVAGANYQVQTPFYLDELCITKTAKWTSNFTPPTAPYHPGMPDILYISSGALKNITLGDVDLGGLKTVSIGDPYYLDLNRAQEATSGFRTLAGDCSRAITTPQFTSRPVITADNQEVDNQSGTFTIEVTHIAATTDFKFTISNNSATRNSESWAITKLSWRGETYTSGTYRYTVSYSNYFYGTVKITLEAKNNRGTTTKTMKFISNYVPPFKSFSLDPQPNSTVLTWNKIQKIVKDNRARDNWTPGDYISYTVTNTDEFSSDGTYNYITATHVMYLGTEQYDPYNPVKADFAWTNAYQLSKGKLYPMVGSEGWTWDQVVGTRMDNFRQHILNGSGDLKNVINSRIWATDGAGNASIHYERFLLLDPGEIYISFDTSTNTEPYPGIEYYGSFWTRKTHYYFNGGTSFVEDANAKKSILLIFRI